MKVMTLALLPALFAVLAVSPSALTAAEDTPLGTVRVIPRVFGLTNDQNLSITHSTVARHYRVCLDEGQGDVAVKVTSDGVDRDIASGDCWDFQAKSIVISPARPLDADVELTGTYLRFRL